jgi:hypothetical protein
MATFYVTLNLFWLIIPLLLLGAIYFRIWWCQLAVILAAVDMLFPLKSRPHGYWSWFFIYVLALGEQRDTIEFR